MHIRYKLLEGCLKTSNEKIVEYERPPKEYYDNLVNEHHEDAQELVVRMESCCELVIHTDAELKEQTEQQNNNVPKDKDNRNKSQYASKDKIVGRKSIDVAKFVQTTRTSGESQSRKAKCKRNYFDEVMTENQPRKDSPFTIYTALLVTNLETDKSAEHRHSKKYSLKKKTEERSPQRVKTTWNDKNAPYDWETVVEQYGHLLSRYEHSEIKEYKKIYYIGHKAKKRERVDASEADFDNEDKEYIYLQNDHIAYRYELLELIGKGSYGQVFKAFDHRYKEFTALKIIKNKTKFSKQAFIEIEILTHIKEKDAEHRSNVVKIKDFVVFRKHVCILFELLSENLYELIIRNNYQGLNFELLRRFAFQILTTLDFLRNENIIHCDLKPENILLREYNKSGIRIVDFGSSCFVNETLYTYIQSRYYRAPEITLGIPYGPEIDIWSTGCILAELQAGVPLFPGENEAQQMKFMVDTLGPPPSSLLSQGSRSTIFFTEYGNLKEEIHKIHFQERMDHFSKSLEERIENDEFRDFIKLFLQWDPETRTTPLQALNHSWIRKGLPEELKNQLSGTRSLHKVEATKSKELPQPKIERISTKKLKSKSKERCVSVKTNNRGSQSKLMKKNAVKLA